MSVNPAYRIQAEIDEIFGDKKDVDADDLDKMIYTKQVILSSILYIMHTYIKPQCDYIVTIPHLQYVA